MKYSIQGFSVRDPLSRGVEMAQSSDKGYAIDIAKALAEKYSAEQQIFGVIRIVDGEVIGRWKAGIQEV